MLSIAFALVALLLPFSLSSPLLPSVDPFYKPPSDFAAKPPGTVLRSRAIVASFFGLVPDNVQAWQLLYRTTAINGSAISAATTVFKPASAKLDRFISFHTAYDGAASSGVCAPSYNYQLGALQVDLVSSVEFFSLQALLTDGYIVSSPDYEGPDSAFGAGRLSGTGVLDSMRAVANSATILNLSTSNPQVVGYGYSGGAIATGWAASLQSTYAPELKIKGWAQGGTPANLTGTTRYVDGTLFSGVLPQALVGLNTPSAYGSQLGPVLDSILTSTGKADLNTAKQICGTENLFTFAFQKIEDSNFQSLGNQVLYEPTIAAVLDRTIMGSYASEVPIAPVYLYHALQDELIPYSNVSTLYNSWCNDGANVQFVTYANGGHLTTETIGFTAAYDFIQSAFAGTVATGCSQQTTLNSTLDPTALGADLEPILVQLLNSLAIAGTKDANIKDNISTLNETIS